MSKKTLEHLFIFFFLFIFFLPSAFSKVKRLRCMWRADPSTTMVIGWDQVAGSNPILYYSTQNNRNRLDQYAQNQEPDKVVTFKGMYNHFVRLTDLSPNTTYYFQIKDSGGFSKIYSFQTAPSSPYSRLSIIAGGDSRNHRKARINANKIVGKLRPHFVLFGGDMTGSDVDEQWLDWFDDWQHTISKDGRLTPIIVARGNHEYSNKTLIELFDVATKGVYYAHTFATDLLRIYTLNSLIPSGGEQKAWLWNDLQNHDHIQWKMAQYHHTIRPHTKRKPEKNNMLLNWATLFYKYQVNLVVESDAHVVKTTYPIRPSRERDSSEGFIRDDEAGTVYIGEGCWGAPLRKNDDPKPWTRASGSFNQFKWIFIDREKIEVRTIQTDYSNIDAVDPYNIFIPPYDLKIWEPPSGAVLSILNRQNNIVANTNGEALAMRGAFPAMEISDFQTIPKDQDILVQWKVKNEPSNLQFELQKSLGDNRYLTVAEINGKANEAETDFDYTYTDKGSGITARGRYIRYRVKYINAVGKEGYYHPPIPKLKEEGVTIKSGKIKKLMTDAKDRLKVQYNLAQKAHVSYQVFDVNRREVFSNYLSDQPAKNYLKSMDLSELPDGRYVLVIKANRAEIKRYQVIKQ